MKAQEREERTSTDTIVVNPERAQGLCGGTPATAMAGELKVSSQRMERKGKPYVLLTGATGGIGSHLEATLRKKYNIIRISRTAASSNVPDGVQHVVADLTDAKDLEKQIPACDIEWVVHLATTYSVRRDLAMLKNLLKVAETRNVPNFCFFSSWVVSFPGRLVREPYLRMKGLCEKMIRDFCGKHGKRYLIVRPSVVIGENLSWSRTLNRLWYVRQLIPRNMFRCWISIDQVTAAVETHFKAVEDGRAGSKVMQLLGERETLYMATHSRTLTSEQKNSLPEMLAFFAAWLLFPLTFALRMVCYVLLFVVSLFSTYMNSFYIQHFRPTSEEELMTFFNAYNNSVVTGAENMLLWHYVPPWVIEQKKILVTTRGMNTIHSISPDAVVCDAGVTIHELLGALQAKGLTISTYPNYHDISIGACIAGPVHGHSHQFATVASLVTEIRLFDIAKQKVRTLRSDTKEFRDLVFNTTNNVLILTVTLRPCPLMNFTKTRKRLDFLTTSPEVLMKHSKMGDSCEVRMYVPVLDVYFGSKLRYLPALYGLTLTATMWNKVEDDEKKQAEGDTKTEGKTEPVDKVESIKGDLNWKKYVENSTKLVWGVGSKAVMNTEWFFTEEEMVKFWKFYQKNWFSLGWYKILIRHCKADNFPNSPCYKRDKFAVDIVALRYQRKYLAEIMPQFSNMMHAGKFLCTDPDKVDKKEV